MGYWVVGRGTTLVWILLCFPFWHSSQPAGKELCNRDQPAVLSLLESMALQTTTDCSRARERPLVASAPFSAGQEGRESQGEETSPPLGFDDALILILGVLPSEPVRAESGCEPQAAQPPLHSDPGS